MSKPESLFAEFPPVSNAAWDAAVAKDLKGADPRTLEWKTEDGIQVKPYYRRDTPAAGRPPILKPGGARWEIRAEVRESDVAVANRSARALVEHGVPTVVFRGPKLADLAALRILLEGLPLERMAVHFDCIPGGARTLELLEKLPKAHELAGSVTCDPVVEMIEDDVIGADIFPEAAVRFQNALRLMPRFLPLVVRVERYHNAGATPVQELALALGAGVEYLAQFSERGIHALDVAENMGFAFGVGSSYFLEIAKFRAMRRLWVRVLGAFDEDAASTPARIFGRTSEWNQTIYDCHNNLLRGTTEAMAAILGGCDAVTVRAYTGNWESAGQDAQRWAANTQLLLRDEAYLDKVADPAAGSWYVEELTDAVAREAWKLFQEIESEGGLVRSLEKGIVENMVRAAREERDILIAKRRRVLVGTNRHANPGEQVRLERAPAPAEQAPLGRTRGAWPFEKIRLATDAAARRPKVFLLVTGDARMRRARAEFAADFFGCAGFEVVRGGTLEEGSGAGLVVLCSSDREYPALAREICPRSQAPVIVAGYPTGSLKELEAAGVADFIHLGSNAVETLERWQPRLGVTGEAMRS